MGDGCAGGGMGEGGWSIVAEDFFFAAAQKYGQEEGGIEKGGFGSVGKSGSDSGEDFARGNGVIDSCGEEAFGRGESKTDAKRSAERYGSLTERDVSGSSN